MGRSIPGTGFGDIPFACEPWRLSAVEAAIELPQTSSVFAIGNGFVGVRGPGDPAGAPRVYLNGVYERVPISYHEAAYGYALESDTRLAVADATRPLIPGQGRTIGIELDYATGICTETVETDRGLVRIERFASMVRTGLVAIRVTLPAGTADIELHVARPPGQACDESGEVYDPRVAPRLHASPWREVSLIQEAGVAGRVDMLRNSGVRVCAILAELGCCEGRGGSRVVDLVASYAAGHGDVQASARDAVEAARSCGFDGLFEEQRVWFGEHWAAMQLGLPDQPAAEGAARHALLQLAQGVARDGSGSIPAKGQTGEGYEGHVFWDADLYVSPVFAWTRPEIARAMLAWRIAGLDAARDNARAMGQSQGALYPWRTIGGRECSSFFPAGPAQYHINADIAFALRTYLEATGDGSILEQGGAEMLAETARIWLQVGFHDPDRGGGFSINRVTGPDEYSAIVDNNLYTNLMAAEHLRFAAAHGAVHATEAEAMLRAADAMILPFDGRRGVYAQDEGFFGKLPWPFDATPEQRYPLLLHHHPLTIYRHQVAKQADAVLAIALMPDRFPPDVRRRMLDIYEAVTVHDSTLSASAFATASARAGDAERAFGYWRASTLTDLADLFGNSGHGLHMAALAGSWTTIAFGFAGLRADGNRLALDPIDVPAIGPYSFTVTFRGSRVRIAVEAGAARFERLCGPPVEVLHSGQVHRLEERLVAARLAS